MDEHAKAAESADIGTDKESCEKLSKTFRGLSAEVSAGKQKQLLRWIEVGADLIELLEEGGNEAHGDTMDSAADLMEDLNTCWERLEDAVEIRRALLSGAYEIHVFTNSAEDILSRIQEKLALASNTTYGDSRAHTDRLKRYHDEFEADLPPIDTEKSKLSNDAGILCTRYPTKASDIRMLDDAIRAKWDELVAATAFRARRLAESFRLHSFDAAYRQAVSWVGDMRRRMESQVLADDVDAADALILAHQRHKADI